MSVLESPKLDVEIPIGAALKSSLVNFGPHFLPIPKAFITFLLLLAKTKPIEMKTDELVELSNDLYAKAKDDGSIEFYELVE